MKVAVIRHICYKLMKKMCLDVIQGDSESWLSSFVSSMLVLHQDNECRSYCSFSVLIYESSHYLKQWGTFSIRL